MVRYNVAFPTEFAALTINSNFPVVVGMPVIAPVDAFRFNPTGSIPSIIAQVIGVVPVAVSLWL